MYVIKSYAGISEGINKSYIADIIGRKSFVNKSYTAGIFGRINNSYIADIKIYVNKSYTGGMSGGLSKLKELLDLSKEIVRCMYYWACKQVVHSCYFWADRTFFYRETNGIYRYF